jgi:hypothetical protein
MSVNGILDVSLIDGFQLASQMEFLFVDVAGNRTGYFSNFLDGSLIGNFGGTDLFITYGAGDGNDIAFFTAIPEPSSAIWLAVVVAGCLCWRRRRPGTPGLSA